MIMSYSVILTRLSNAHASQQFSAMLNTKAFWDQKVLLRETLDFFIHFASPLTFLYESLDFTILNSRSTIANLFAVLSIRNLPYGV